MCIRDSDCSARRHGPSTGRRSYRTWWSSSVARRRPRGRRSPRTLETEERPEDLHRHGSMADELLVERPLVELPAGLHVALPRLDLVPPEEVLTELGRVELGPEQLSLRQRLFLETLLLHEAERFLVAHLPALEPDVQDGVCGHDHAVPRLPQCCLLYTSDAADER